MHYLDSFRLTSHSPAGCKERDSQASTGLEEGGCHAPSFQILESLIREGAALKREIDDKTARLRSINLLLAESAPFKSGQKSACLIGGGYKVRIRLHENITWDQERIAAFRKYLPAEKFLELFRMIFEPTSKKEIDGFIAHADKELSDGLKWCMSVKAGAPQLTYEKLD
ncbi:MAG: hypothetical protein P4L55_12400 [Syntrophobacteraceae bacterium]|nr:hypothetical protein [Syntrophobacteraceae bacterium]